jgi:pyruvate formate lyase activating enzyme
VATLAEELAARTRPADLVEPLEGTRVRCLACGHRCPISDGFSGVCKVRYNRGGTLYAPYGYVSVLHCDPIEKKPFFHVLPGSLALSFGMPGCSLHCSYCQNWVTSQALRDPGASVEFRSTTPEKIVSLALATGALAVVSTYNEPLITAEWAAAVFAEAHRNGLLTGMVSNGSATREVLEYLRPHMDLYKVDLKTFDDARYHELGARLQPVLDGVALAHAMGYWVEIVTLVVPGWNDSDAELGQIADFLAGVSVNIPWHVTAFHPDYKMDLPSTPRETLVRAVEIGRRAGLRYTYAGNVVASGHEDTNCYQCGETLIRRRGFQVSENRLLANGLCPQCRTRIPGRWRTC